ncbi:vacuolar membrane protein-domain-containing protein [Mycotypha africana]|uniref:vacuolar membrane protein-domain-containing protein n=1 Tax=Mycotypha africana TaxID=64632 RepID=UPI002301CBF8|nr:vacuolar membrane protein-domain-containing protein [Mycotypha africana]KAI8991286.1 vacuolar membrane protein-domain-containing protein [Mycotypha africana]
MDLGQSFIELYGENEEQEDQSGCKLLDSFAIFVQLVLAGLAFSTLILKRQRESPQRPLLIWTLDVSKQLIGGIVIHTLNLIASHIFGKSLDEEGEASSNPCVWYFLNILIDTTLGVFIIWAVVHNVQFIARHYRWKGFQSGVYGEPPLVNQLRVWAKQLGVYIFSLVIMKWVVVMLFKACPWIETIGEWVLSWTMGNYRIQVLFVMLIFPLVMNTVQFWIVDSIVKHKRFSSIYLHLEDDEALLPDDTLIPDGEYQAGNAVNSSSNRNDDHFFVNTAGSDEEDATSISSVDIHQHPFNDTDEANYTSSQPLKDFSNSNRKHNITEDEEEYDASLYELRTNNEL